MIARAVSTIGWNVTVVDRGSAAGGTSSTREGNHLVAVKGPGHELVLAQYASTLVNKSVAQLSEQLVVGAFPSAEFGQKSLMVGAPPNAGARSLQDFSCGQRSAGIDARLTTAAETHELERDFAPGIEAAVFHPENCQVHPTTTTEVFVALGGRFERPLRENTRTTGPILDSAGALVGTLAAAGELRATRVLKLSTRAGLDICRGRTCWRSLETLLADRRADQARRAHRLGDGPFREPVLTRVTKESTEEPMKGPK